MKPGSDDSVSGPSRKTARNTTRPSTSTKLVAQALATLDADALVRMTGIPIERLQRWARPSYKMTIAQQGVIALAVIALAPDGSPLFRAAAALRGQIAAAIEYGLGVTSTAAAPPRIRLS